MSMRNASTPLARISVLVYLITLAMESFVKVWKFDQQGSDEFGTLLKPVTKLSRNSHVTPKTGESLTPLNHTNEPLDKFANGSEFVRSREKEFMTSSDHAIFLKISTN